MIICRKFAFRPNWCSPLRQSHYRCYPARPRRPGRCGLVVRICARGGWRLCFYSLATNLVFSPEFMMDTSRKLELVMINVLPASKLAPNMTFERLVCQQDVVCVICVTLQDVTPILLLAGHHLYSWPQSVLNVEFPMKNARIKPVIWPRPCPTPSRFLKVIIACNMLCSSV